MPRSPEMGFNPEEGKDEPRDKKPERKIKVIKPAKKLELTLEDINVVPEQELEFKLDSQKETLPVKDWAEELRAAAKLKMMERDTAEKKARKDFDDLFKE